MKDTFLKGRNSKSLNFGQFLLLVFCSFLLVFSYSALAKPARTPNPEISEVIFYDMDTLPVMEIMGDDFENRVFL